MSARTFLNATFTGFRGSKVRQYPNIALLTVEGSVCPQTAAKLVGQKVCIVNPESGKTIYGKISRTHGNSGVVRARFQTNLCPRLMGKPAKVCLAECTKKAKKSETVVVC